MEYLPVGTTVTVDRETVFSSEAEQKRERIPAGTEAVITWVALQPEGPAYTVQRGEWWAVVFPEDLEA